MRKILLILLTVFLVGCGAESPFKDVVSMDIYNIDPIKYEKVELKLLSMKPVSVVEDDLGQVLSASSWQKDDVFIWQGSQLGVLKKQNGTEIKIAISLDGNYIKVLGEKGVYQFTGENKLKWERIINPHGGRANEKEQSAQ